MGTRFRVTIAVISVFAVVGLAVPASTARGTAVPKVSSLAAAGSNLSAAKLGVKWKKVAGARYQVRWAASTKALRKAKVYPTTKTSAMSPTLSNVCITWYAQVRAKKRGRFGAWSTPKALRFSGLGSVSGATPITTGQTSTTAAQVRWARKPGAVGYRLHYSPAPFGNWPGYFPYTPTTSATTTGLSLPLPAVDEGDRFMAPRYGNPLFAQLETKRCDGKFVKTPFVPVFPKPAAPGDSSSGDALRFGIYNVEKVPQDGNPRIAVLAHNIKAAGVDVIALQEADAGTATALKDQLGSVEGQTDWDSFGVGQQQVMWRTTAWVDVSTVDVGKPADGAPNDLSDSAKTPLPTPAVQLTPAVADTDRQDIFVVSAHLEDRTRYEPTASNYERKQDAHDAALSLLASIETANPLDVPTLVGGDLKGNFGGAGQPAGTGFCDESSPPCVGEGQPTFIRAGYTDARAAVTKVGIEYGTVNGHDFPQLASSSGIGSRADFIVVRGFPGISRYENVANKTSTDSPSDHNLIYAILFVPHTS